MKKLMLLFAIFSIFELHVCAQNTITGKVIDDSGDALPGVSVLVKGTTIGTMTIADGTFSLEVPEGSETLVFSYIGMETQETAITGAVINVTLLQSSKELEEVVVTALGIKREKKALGYSVSTVDSEELTKKPEADIASALKGKVAGVNIVGAAGIVGAGSSITIRGSSSINGSNQPLFVVDGIPFNASSNQIGGFSSGGGNTNMASSRFLDIDPNMIESINILKGLTASVLYGEAGRNGVILITTKGTSAQAEEKFEANVNQSVYVNMVAQLPDYLNSYGQGGDNVTNVGFAGNWGNPFSDDLMVQHHLDQAQFAASFPQFQGEEVLYQPYENNVKDFFRNGWSYNTSVNILNGFKNGNVSFNAGYTDEDGYIPENNLKRLNSGLVVNFQKNKFKFSGNINYVNTQYKTPPVAARGAFNAVTIFERLLYIPRNLDLTNLPYQDPIDGSSVYYRNDQENPYWLLYNSSNLSNNNRIWGYSQVKYDITDKLSLQYKFGLDRYSDNKSYYINKGGVSSTYAENGYKRDAFIENKVYNQDLILNLSEINLTNDINVGAVAGTQIRSERYNRTGITSVGQIVFGGLQHDNFETSSNIDPLTGVALDSERETNLIGVYGQATAGFRNYLYLTLSGRNDWGSTVEKENRSIFYPSVSLSFIPTDALTSLKGDFLNYLKLRLNYATSSEFPGAYLTRDSYVLDPQSFDNGQGSVPSIFASTILGNPNLKPALHSEYEIGVESYLWKNKISFEGTYYYKVSKNQIVTKRLDPAVGSNITFVNLGRVDTWGYEVNLGLNPINSKSFSWQMNNVFGAYRSEVIDTGGDKIMTAGFTNQGNFAIEGQPLGVIVGNYAVKDDEGRLLINANDGKIIDSNDLGYDTDIVGDPTPDWKLSSINILSYKGLSFSFQLDYTHGGDFYSQTISTLLRRGVTKDTENREVTYILPGILADPNTGIPLTDENGNTIENNIQLGLNDVHFLNINDPTSGGIYDASIFRIRELSLAYSLPQNFINKLSLTGASLGISAQNLWYYAPNVPEYTNFDPETLSTGVGNGMGLEFNSAPSSKKFAFTLKMSF